MVLAWMVASTSVGGRAQQTTPSTVQQLVLTPGYQRNLAGLFAQMPPEVFQRCPALVSKGSSVTIIEPASFASDGYPVAGLWRQSFPVSGCGNDTTINFFFKAGPDEKLLSIVAVPGDTHAGLQLQKDAIGYATLAVRIREKNCSVLHLLNTAYVGSTTGTSVAGRAAPWREVWTISACGKRYDVPVAFIPDATGTRISASRATPAAS